MLEARKMRFGMRVMALLFTLSPFHAFTSYAQEYNQIDEEGNVSRRNENFNKHNNDTTRNKEIPKGFHAWTIDRITGDMTPAVPDTVPHLFMNTTFNSGMYGEYNHTGSNYTSRLSRIFFNRPANEVYFFSQPYSFVEKRPEKFLFMNTFSPYTTILYDQCGDKTSGEDHIDAKFAVNANKRLNFGFDLEYAYARGYFQNQNQSHFNATLFSSYTGDKYSMHAFFTTSHQKAEENGGIDDDDFIVHPEVYTESFSENEIPTVLTDTWNRNDHQHLFFTHRYNIGFYRKVKMTDEEIKARQFAQAAQKEKEDREAKKAMENGEEPPQRQRSEGRPSGRPDNARIVGAEPKAMLDSIAAQAIDTTRIKIEDQATLDSLTRAQAIQDSIDATMKDEFVPVTSFFHTLDGSHYRHIYVSYETPDDYYKYRYLDRINLKNDSISDKSQYLRLRNTFGIGLLEGFNKYVKAGLKVFISHEHRSFELPDTVGSIATLNTWKENDISIGGRLTKTQGRTFHFNLGAETWIAGENAGQLRLDFSTDVNFALFGDTVRLAANAYFRRDKPGFFLRHYHGKHVWWDNDLSAETRTRIEGVFSYEKTNTTLRVGIEEMQNYTYFGMSYDNIDDTRQKLTAGVYQESGNINVLMAQLHQNFRLGPLNWENVITYQNSSNKEALPLPTWNIFTNLYLKFKIAKVLGVELGADAVWFSKYYAPDFCPMINQFAIQQNPESRVELGGYPWVDVYANMVLKKVRFFVMMSHVNADSGNRMRFLTPHYPTNGSVLHFGVSWVFFN